ncbi:MAG TPA: DUF3644 domain-containing protein [Candidatus Saccharimonadales bacterium]
MLEGAVDEALLAVDLYNQPAQARRLEGFFIHMHIAWLYLLQARFHRDHIDYRYRLPNGWFDRVDGEPKTWDLQKCVSVRYPQGGPINKNLEFTIGLRNKIEHRYEETIAMVASGYAQALLINFENELVETFGLKYSLGDRLRFPILVGTITGLSESASLNLRDGLPRSARDFIARFEQDLDASVINDNRYEFRLHLVPKLGPKAEADRALTFVRESDLSEEERQTLSQLGRAGRVIVREQVRPVVSADLLRPSQVVAAVQSRLPFRFNMQHFVDGWRKLECRPPSGARHPERTEQKYCIYDRPHRDYLYTQAFVDKLVREASTKSRFRRFYDRDAQPLDK